MVDWPDNRQFSWRDFSQAELRRGFPLGPTPCDLQDVSLLFVRAEVSSLWAQCTLLQLLFVMGGLHLVGGRGVGALTQQRLTASQ